MAERFKESRGILKRGWGGGGWESFLIRSTEKELRVEVRGEARCQGCVVACGCAGSRRDGEGVDGSERRGISPLVSLTLRVAGARVTGVQPIDPRGPYPGCSHTPLLHLPEPPRAPFFRMTADSKLGDTVKVG